MTRWIAGWLAVGAVVLAGCRGCDGQTREGLPGVRVSPEKSLYFGPVRVGSELESRLTVHSIGLGTLQVTGARVEDLGGNGASAAYTVIGVPLSVPRQKQDTLRVRFAPTAQQGYEALLVLETNDPDNEEIELTLVGDGALSQLELTPVCRTDSGFTCKGTVTVDPPAIDFGRRTFQGAAQPTVELPEVVLVNPGQVSTLVTALDFEGPDAAAFAVVGEVLTDTGPGGEPALVLEANQDSRSIPLRFTPTSATQASYEATLVVRSDAAGREELRVALKGELQPNRSPVACANLVRVEFGDLDGARDYSSEAHWAPLREAPAGDLSDLSDVRDVRPGDVPVGLDEQRPVTEADIRPTEVLLSAHSSTDTTLCTSDPDDGRTGLSYVWRILSQPASATQTALVSPTEPETRMRLGPQSGTYEVELTVSDAQGLSARRVLRFEAVPKKDLVVQLDWGTQQDAFRGVDLDLHLVRPSTVAAAEEVGETGPFAGAFAFFEETGPNEDLVSGDINGRTRDVRRNFSGTPPFTFNWGEAGIADDPRQPWDDTGGGALLETVSLDGPANDAACATSSCRYKVLVHYFRDGRDATGAPACTVTGQDGCVDGARCDCAPDFACVTNTFGGTGAVDGRGRCLRAPQLQVRVYFRGNVEPAASVPVDGQALLLGAPCQMVHVADVVWPPRLMPDGSAPGPGDDLGAPTVEPVEAPQPVQAYGERGSGGLACAPNGQRTPPGQTIPWYDPAP